MSETTHTIVLIENYWTGWLHFIAWIAALTGGIGLAVWLGSTAMQWCMAVFWFLSLIGWASGQAKRLTVEQAYTRISALKAEQDAATDEAAA